MIRLLGNEIGYAGQELEKQSLYRQLCGLATSRKTSWAVLLSGNHFCVFKDDSELALNVFLCEMLYMVVFFLLDL